MRVILILRGFMWVLAASLIVTWFLSVRLANLETLTFQEQLYPLARTSGSILSSSVEKEQQQKQQAQFCLDHRGESGHWVLDWEYAAKHAYKTFGVFPKTMIANQVFKPTLKQPYRVATAYRWNDNACPITTLTHSGFCQVVKRLGISRIYSAGDSLTEAFTSSLRSLLGFPKWASSQFMNRRWSQPCYDHNDKKKNESTTPWFVNHTYRRVQTPNTDYYQFFQEATLSESRRDFIQDNPDVRTAIILNIGAHVHSLANFTHSFQSLLNALDNELKLSSKDLVFFRNTAPGHADCFPHQPPRQIEDWDELLDDAPYHSYQQYLTRSNEEAAKKFDWHLFEAYNSHAQQMLSFRQKQSEASNDHRVKIYLLNIFNSTVLRRDGHVGMDDCLHYSLPGPTDWWVHLWYSALCDIASLEGK